MTDTNTPQPEKTKGLIAKNKKVIYAAAILVAIAVTLFIADHFTLNIVSGGTEHPEHPADTTEKEHPEHPANQTEKKQLTIEEFADAVNDYIAAESNNNDGFFLVNDEKQNKELKLTLLKVHREKLSALGDDTYFVCADFTGEDGKTYDIDIFMKGDSKENLEATEKMVHKVNGKERYLWYEEDNVWKRKEQ